MNPITPLFTSFALIGGLLVTAGMPLVGLAFKDVMKAAQHQLILASARNQS